MSQKDKLLKAIRNNPKNVSFQEIKKLLEGHGFVCHDGKGSHFVFKREGFSPVSIPRKKPIKAVYVHQVINIIDEIEKDEP